nr:hypothetical protein [Alphaproteobacteria bacterium]
MNLIDHSVEQVDFALRRRFLWEKCLFDADVLKIILEEAWKERGKDATLPTLTKQEQGVFTRAIMEAATKINETITKDALLGEDYQLGQAFFKKAIELGFAAAHREKVAAPSAVVLAEHATKSLWRLVVEPLLHEYLRGSHEGGKLGEALKKFKTSFAFTAAEATAPQELHDEQSDEAEAPAPAFAGSEAPAAEGAEDTVLAAGTAEDTAPATEE